MVPPITQVINNLSDVVVQSAFFGCVGYLCARAVNQVDPRVFVVCGLTAGAITSLFATKHSNTSSGIVAIAAGVFIPFNVCQKLELPVTFKMAVVVTWTTLVTSIALQYFSQIVISKLQGCKT